MVDPDMLNGQTVLIVEAEFLIALDIQRMLETLMAGPMIFARSPQEAHEHRQRWSGVDLAIVEIGRDQDPALSLLSALQESGIALIIVTTDSTMNQGHPAFPGAPVVVKPMVEDAFHGAVTQALDQSSRTNGYGS
tara:strand:- start:4583 stop:4987 length:405 start_codon:yes stop_codon:yes gene_type:complete